MLQDSQNRAIAVRRTKDVKAARFQYFDPLLFSCEPTRHDGRQVRIILPYLLPYLATNLLPLTPAEIPIAKEHIITIHPKHTKQLLSIPSSRQQYMLSEDLLQEASGWLLAAEQEDL